MGWIGELGVEIMKFINRIVLKPSREIKKVVKIYDEMHKVLEQAEVQRILIFKAHNGGGLISPNTPLYISALHEDYTTPFTAIKESFQQMRVDGEYIRMLDEICQNKHKVVNIDKLKPQFLKDFYIGEGIRYAEFFFLGQDRKNIYLATVESAWDAGWSDHPQQKLQVQLAINLIRNNIM